MELKALICTSNEFKNLDLSDFENDLFLEVGGGENPIFLYILKSLNKKLKFQVLEEQNFKINIPQEYKDYLNYVYKLEDVKFNNLKAKL